MEPRPDEAGAETLLGPAAEAAQAERDGYLLTAALTQRVDLIRHLVDFSRQIIVVVGEEGSGKTTLLHHLLGTTPEYWRVAKVNADPMCDADALLKRLGAELGLNLSERGAIEERVNAFKHYLETARRSLLVPVMLVDDAHLLPADSLLLLLRLAEPESDAPHLRVALFWDPRVTRLLGSPQLAAFKDSLTHTVEMPLFALEDTANYIATHWPPADDESSPLLNEEYLREVHAAAAGVPGRINALVRTSLDVQPLSKEAVVEAGPRMNWGFAVAGAAAALTLAITFWWLRPQHRDTAVSPLSPGDSAAIDVTPQTVSALLAEPLDAAPVASTPNLIAEPLPETPPVVQALPPEPDTATPSHASLTAPGTAPATLSTAPGSPPAVEQPKVATVEKAPAPAKKPAAKAQSNDWLQRQPQSNFVVQLHGSYHRAAAENFIVANRLGDRAVVVPTIRERKTWYVVVSGPYADRTKARTAIGKLPDALQRLNPWVRSVRELQAIAAAPP
ncbi:MAG: AAA family ATPase [Chromatiales bacterium]